MLLALVGRRRLVSFAESLTIFPYHHSELCTDPVEPPLFVTAVGQFLWRGLPLQSAHPATSYDSYSPSRIIVHSRPHRAPVRGHHPMTLVG